MLRTSTIALGQGCRRRGALLELLATRARGKGAFGRERATTSGCRRPIQIPRPPTPKAGTRKAACLPPRAGLQALQLGVP